MPHSSAETCRCLRVIHCLHIWQRQDFTPEHRGNVIHQPSYVWHYIPRGRNVPIHCVYNFRSHKCKVYKILKMIYSCLAQLQSRLQTQRTATWTLQSAYISVIEAPIQGITWLEFQTVMNATYSKRFVRHIRNTMATFRSVRGCKLLRRHVPRNRVSLRV